MTETGFLAVYRWRVEPDAEAAFIARWEDATRELAALGGQGSCLTRAEDGAFVAIAKWPSEAARDAAFSASAGRSALTGVKRLSEEKLAVVSDLWR
ncbi:MAG: antibiotic biosynthesis monooxygenase [Pacificimonas sp.]|jgi:heme-degrading monooxygenase HmoA|nr:antibiotic biosynthesis monooxygenase [Pacificimonas sp.]